MLNPKSQSSEANLIELGQYIEKLVLDKIGNNFNEAARFIGISSAELFSLRKGERKNPSPKILTLVAEKLNGNYNYMMSLAGYNPPQDEEFEKTLQLLKPVLDNMFSDAIFLNCASEKSGISINEIKDYPVNKSLSDLFTFALNNGVAITFSEGRDGKQDLIFSYTGEGDDKTISGQNSLAGSIIKTVLPAGGSAQITPYSNNRIKLPIIGTVTAGPNGLAYAEPIGEEWTDEEDINNGAKYYWLQIKGDSMIGDGIMPGDLALIREQPEVEYGELAVVIVDGEEGTLKRVYKKEDSIVLQSSNPLYPPRIFAGKEAETIRIAGKVKVTKRKY